MNFRLHFPSKVQVLLFISSVRNEPPSSTCRHFQGAHPKIGRPPCRYTTTHALPPPLCKNFRLHFPSKVQLLQVLSSLRNEPPSSTCRHFQGAHPQTPKPQ